MSDAPGGAADKLGRRAFWPMQYALRSVLRSLGRAMPVGEGAFEISSRSTTTIAETLVPGVVEHLQRRLGEPVSIAEIAASLRLSVSTVSHAYQKLVGETPMKTLRRLRIHRLKVLLAEGWSLDAAAHDAGFCDAHHASREFKRAEGITPSGFLRVLREAAA